MTATPDGFTVEAVDGRGNPTGDELRTITHTDGSTTIVPGNLSDDDAARLAALSGDELNAAIADVTEKQQRDADRQQLAAATQAVVDDPPELLGKGRDAADAVCLGEHPALQQQAGPTPGVQPAGPDADPQTHQYADDATTYPDGSPIDKGDPAADVTAT